MRRHIKAETNCLLLLHHLSWVIQIRGSRITFSNCKTSNCFQRRAGSSLQSRSELSKKITMSRLGNAYGLPCLKFCEKLFKHLRVERGDIKEACWVLVVLHVLQYSFINFRTKKILLLPYLRHAHLLKGAYKVWPNLRHFVEICEGYSYPEKKDCLCLQSHIFAGVVKYTHFEYLQTLC